MATDIAHICISANPIKHGTLTVLVAGPPAVYVFNNDHVPKISPPSDTDLEDKYTTRLDDPTYYG